MDRNRRIIDKAARRHGAVEVLWRNGRNHHLAVMRLANGIVATMHFSAGMMDTYKLAGWTRQAIMRAQQRARA